MDGTNAYIYERRHRAPAEQVNLSTGDHHLPGRRRPRIRPRHRQLHPAALTGTTAYDAWGNPEASGGLSATTPFGFAGGYTDPDGLIYLLNRYYDPGTGQFLSVDPDLAQTQEPYVYAGGDPVINTDPTGDEWVFKGWTFATTQWFGTENQKGRTRMDLKAYIHRPQL